MIVLLQKIKKLKSSKKLLTNKTSYAIIHFVVRTYEIKKQMHEWLSGGVSPCQGEGRGFESRLVLLMKEVETVKTAVSTIFLCV